MNLPNQLSLSRILAIPILLVCLLPQTLLGIDGHFAGALFRIAALLIVIVVAYTDWLDGKIAREQGLVTNLGKLLDPLADKIFVTSALVAMVELRLLPAWAVILVIAREFLITGLRSLALESGRVIPADRLGKHKTGWQLALIITAIVMQIIRDFLSHYLPAAEYPDTHHIAAWTTNTAIWIPLAVTLILTIVSGWTYLRDNRDLLKEQ